MNQKRCSRSASATTDNILSSTSVYDNTAASQLAAAFPNLISTDVMHDLMLDRLGKPYINGYISARSFADSNLMLLTVRSTSPDDAYSVLCAVIDCYPQVAAYMTENPNIIISEAPINAGRALQFLLRKASGRLSARLRGLSSA